MTMRDKIKADIKEQKAKNKITDFIHTKPCGYCGSTHGCGCGRELDRGAEKSNNSWNF